MQKAFNTIQNLQSEVGVASDRDTEKGAY